MPTTPGQLSRHDATRERVEAAVRALPPTAQTFAWRWKRAIEAQGREGATRDGLEEFARFVDDVAALVVPREGG